MKTIRRGQVWLACLDPVLGHELAKTSPLVVVSNDEANRHSGLSSVVPVTSKKLETLYPFEVFLPQGSGGLPKDSKAKAEQIRTLAHERFVRPLGTLEADLMSGIEEALRIHLSLD